ncbi:MAG TPA: LEA type 2 family protein [Flavitalea sp.]|nr:LEA type 2 family protein [Flavitalea sp.]
MLKIGTVVLFSCLCFLSCAKPKGFDYLGFEQVRILQWGLKESTVGFQVKLYNPNKYKMEVKSANVDIFMNSKFLGHSDLDTLFQIPKSDTFSFPVKMKVETSSAIGGLISSAADTAIIIRIEGKAKIGKGGIFFNYPIHYEGTPKIPQLLK